jgi:DNA gyrase subunit A
MLDVRWIPDVSDGLDPVQRRVLSLLAERYVKCADVVSDAPSYETLVHLAQDFRQRYPLVEGRGNFGSVDGDPPADPQYTAARLAPIARALPRFPNVLVNGSRTIPPHNLREAVAALIAYIDDADIDVAGLMEHMPGPDFPTGGVIADPSRVRAAYETGTGAISLRARSHTEEHAIVVTELPYTVDKAGDDGIIRELADLSSEGRLPELVDLQDQSERRGARIVIGLRRDADPLAVLTRLRAHTSLEITFPVELVALIDGAPRRLALRELIGHFLAARDAARLRRELDDVANRFGDDRRTLLEDDGVDG